MKRFIKDEEGNALLWPLFIILILLTISFLVYSGITIYAKYQTCENELQQAAIISTDMNMENANVRDLLLDIPSESAKSTIEDNLIDLGWMQEDGSWVKYDNGKMIYSLDGVQIEIEGKALQIKAIFVMPLPWTLGDISTVSIPMQVRASILYLDSRRG